MKIQKQIIEIMKEQGISYRAFAEQLGCSTRTLIEWKNKETKSFELVDKALSILGFELTICKKGEGK